MAFQERYPSTVIPLRVIITDNNINTTHNNNNNSVLLYTVISFYTVIYNQFFIPLQPNCLTHYHKNKHKLGENRLCLRLIFNALDYCQVLHSKLSFLP